MVDPPGAVPPGQPPGRTGDEPRTARSPLRARLLLAVGGAVFCALVAVGALTAEDAPMWLTVLGLVLAALALAGVVDAAVIRRRLRAGRAR